MEVIFSEKMLVVVFDSVLMAYKGEEALEQLDKEGTISVHSASVIKKNPNGSVEISETKDKFPIRSVEDTAVGSLIGLLGGPIGVLVGGASGVLLGALDDLHRSGVNTDFLNDVSDRLTPNKFALVADISEESVSPLDAKMENLGGLVFRARKRYVEIEQMKGYIAMLDADISQMNREMKDTRNEQKANLQARIENLKEKRREQRTRAKQRLEQIEKECDIKVQALEAKAANAQGKTKAALQARITQIKNEYEKTLTKWKNLKAERSQKR